MTLSQTKDYLSISSGDTSKDSWVETLINASSDLIERTCGRSFKSASRTNILDGHGTNEVVLPHYPVSSVTSVKIDGERVFGADTALAVTEFEVSETGILRLHEQRFPEGSKVVKVEYTAGFTAIPADLQLACLFTVEWMFRTQNDRRLGRTTVTKGNETIENVPGIPKDILMVLEPFVSTSLSSELLRPGVTG